MPYKTYDVVTVPFPFTDRNQSKRRPAVVLSAEKHLNTHAGHTVLAMITSAGNTPWPLDAEITDLDSAGLPSPSVIRMKLFTLDNRLIVKRLGSLSAKDRASLTTTINKLFSDLN